MAKKRKSKFGRFILAAAFLAVMGAFALNFYQQELRLQALREEKEQLESNRDELMVEKNRLDRLHNYTKTDEYVEQYVRERLGWVKEGEIVFKLPEEAEQE